MTSKIAIIPARGNSKRLPRKNILPFHNGNPIIHYPIRSAIDSGLFDDVIVSSDDNEILEYAKNCGATPSKRPERLSGDDVSEIEAYRFVLNWCRSLPEYFVALYATAVFITGNDIVKCVNKLIGDDASVCMGVSEYEYHPYQMLNAYKDKSIGNGNLYLKLAWPDKNDDNYPPAYCSNGSIYAFNTKDFIKNPTYFPPKLTGIITKSVDINTASDFERAQNEFARRR